MASFSNRKNNLLRLHFEAMAVALVIMILIRFFWIQPFHLTDNSMDSAKFKKGDYVLVNRLIYYFQNPEREDIVVHRSSEGKLELKRVAGLPGEKVSINNQILLIDDKPLDSGFYKSLQSFKTGIEIKNFEPFILKEGEYFVMTDNPSFSLTSNPECITKKSILGKVFLIFWPLKKMDWA